MINRYLFLTKKYELPTSELTPALLQQVVAMFSLVSPVTKTSDGSGWGTYSALSRNPRR